MARSKYRKELNTLLKKLKAEQQQSRERYASVTTVSKQLVASNAAQPVMPDSSDAPRS